MTRRRVVMPADTQLVHDGKVWRLTFGRYRLELPSCDCTRPPCTCKRTFARRDRHRTHHRMHCHAGHAFHVAAIFAAAIR